MPIKDGGLGLRKVGEDSDRSFETSVMATKPLTDAIINQSFVLPDAEVIKKAKAAAVVKMHQAESTRVEHVKNAQPAGIQRSLEQLSEPGASSWLGALPLKSQGFDLNKGEFQDALALRYDKPVKNLPSQCPCGSKFTTAHAMDCSLGGFINARHDNIRDAEADLLKSVLNDVEREPPLQQVTNKTGYCKTAKIQDQARLDVRARGFWRAGQNAYFDVRVTNPDNSSQQNKSLKAVLRNHEMEKKRHYNRRIMEVEHGTFTPLVFTTTGVMSHECTIFHKALAEKISKKKGDTYQDIMRYLRVKFSFLAMKATLLCLRGSRSLAKRPDNATTDDFGLALNELGL